MKNRLELVFGRVANPLSATHKAADSAQSVGGTIGSGVVGRYLGGPFSAAGSKPGRFGLG